MSNYERPGDEIRMPKAKKRALSSSSDSSESEGASEEKVVEKAKKKKNHAEKKVKTTTSSSDEQAKAKKAKKERKEQPEKAKEVAKESALPVKESEKKKPLVEPVVHKTTTVKDMLRLKRDKMRKIEQGKTTSSGTTTATDDEGGESESVSSLAVSESSRDSHPETAAPVNVNVDNGVKEISLPENLPTDIASLIANLKQQVESTASTKSNVFDVHIMDQLVTIDNGAKNVSASVRVQTFNYLEQFMPITKKTLFTKVRKHRVEQVENKVKNEVNKLRKIVIETMPLAIAKYDMELKQYEARKSIQNVVGDMSFEANVPRKKYHWHDSSRLVLAEIQQNIQDLYKIAKPKKETVDDFLLRKFSEEVVPLWPEGWIKPEDLKRELERKKKKETKARIAAAAPDTIQPKSNTASTSNGKASIQAQKTENPAKQSETDVPMVNGKAQKPTMIPVPSSSPASVIKRSSDHSINSIISSSPSPPTTSHSAKAFETIKPRVIDLEKLTSPNDLLKVVAPKSSLPKFSSSSDLPIDIGTPEKASVDKVRRSDSSDSDCVEIVGEFSPIKPVKSLYNNNNNNINKGNLPASHPAPIAKKIKKHGSDDGEHETDYSKIIMGIQSLTVRGLFSDLSKLLTVLLNGLKIFLTFTIIINRIFVPFFRIPRRLISSW